MKREIELRARDIIKALEKKDMKEQELEMEKIWSRHKKTVMVVLVAMSVVFAGSVYAWVRFILSSSGQ